MPCIAPSECTNLIVLQGIHSHLACPLVCLGMDSGAVQNLDVGVVTAEKTGVFEQEKSLRKKNRKGECSWVHIWL